jgi:hypothetical protein
MRQRPKEMCILNKLKIRIKKAKVINRIIWFFKNKKKKKKNINIKKNLRRG